jgi:putative solute:sodium symporter small subunit
MNGSKGPYRVNFFKPKRGYMRDEVRITLLILLGWLILTFGFQLLVALLGGANGQSSLTARTLFTLPFHFWFTGQFLPLWFIILCIVFNLCIDRLSESHSRRRDRSYD